MAIQNVGAVLPIFLLIFFYIIQANGSTFIYPTRRRLILTSPFPLVRGPLLRCQTKIRTRACLSSHSETLALGTNRATPHPVSCAAPWELRCNLRDTLRPMSCAAPYELRRTRWAAQHPMSCAAIYELRHTLSELRRHLYSLYGLGVCSVFLLSSRNLIEELVGDGSLGKSVADFLTVKTEVTFPVNIR